MAFFRVEHREPVLTSGGGEINTAIQTIAVRCSQEVREFVFAKAVEAAEEAAINWPIGPERPWEPDHFHSAFRFDVQDDSRGFFISVSVINPADYGEFIHEPGKPDRLVWEREIVEKLQEIEGELQRGVEEIIERCFAEG